VNRYNFLISNIEKSTKRRKDMEGTLELEFKKPDTVKIVKDEGRFGDKRDGGKRKHKGLDFNSTRRSHIKASEDGMVVKSEKKEGIGYGETIIIDHTPKAGKKERHIYTLYAHLYKRLPPAFRGDRYIKGWRERNQ
jgi:murein DD-endopeptidase MepM/ murein hydrolase activator NlpD